MSPTLKPKLIVMSLEKDFCGGLVGQGSHKSNATLPTMWKDFKGHTPAPELVRGIIMYGRTSRTLYAEIEVWVSRSCDVTFWTKACGTVAQKNQAIFYDRW